MDLNLRNRVAVITGGGGGICGAIAEALAAEGAAVAIWDISLSAAEAKSAAITSESGRAMAIECDATNKKNVEQACNETVAQLGTVDILINGAGGSRTETTTAAGREFFDIETQSMHSVLDLNYFSAVVPSQVVGRIFAAQKKGAILNISSITGIKPVTRAISYSNAKAATNNFTQWLAVHMARNYAPEIRVNAIAPGFILTEQNRFLLVDRKTGEYTERTSKVIRQCPMGRLGNPHEIVGAALWLVSEMASFVTGAVLPVDGGYTAYSGV